MVEQNPELPSKSPEQVEIDQLKAQVETYKAQLGKKLTPYPSTQVVDHRGFYDGKHLLLGFVSDTHFGSKLARYHDLDAAYKVFEKEGVHRVYHAGDLTAGVGVYKGQHNELTKHSFEEQKDDVITQYPLVDKIKTWFITGNHDASFLKSVGADIGIAVGAARKDLVYLGQIEADIRIARATILRLKHPGGGGAYALSYPLQKEINSFEGGRKPHILAEGHRHTAFFVDYRNVYALQVPCFEYQSLFMKEKGLMPTCGVWIAEIHIKDGSVNRFKPELVKFY